MTRASLAAAISDVADRDPVLADLVALVGPVTHRPRDPDGHFGTLVRAIVFQQLAGPAARAIHQRGVRVVVQGDLTPEALGAAPDGALRGAGLSAAKLASLGTCPLRSKMAPSSSTGRRSSPTTRSSPASAPCAASAGGRPRCT